jgi:hypothetical protein
MSRRARVIAWRGLFASSFARAADAAKKMHTMVVETAAKKMHTMVVETA